jgi:8-oxo-dGTP pyrophosphatase MutT (NUDIX family)
LENYSLTKLNCSGGLILSRVSKRFLFLQRTQAKTQGTWALVGGKSQETDRSPLDTLTREISEELGFLPDIEKIVPLDLYTSSDNRFSYGTYVVLVEHEFIPRLNHEHSGYAWCEYCSWPKPLHNGVRNTLNNVIVRAKLETVLQLI